MPIYRVGDRVLAPWSGSTNGKYEATIAEVKDHRCLVDWDDQDPSEWCDLSALDQPSGDEESECASDDGERASDSDFLSEDAEFCDESSADSDDVSSEDDGAEEEKEDAHGDDNIGDEEGAVRARKRARPARRGSRQAVTSRTEATFPSTSVPPVRTTLGSSEDEGSVDGIVDCPGILPKIVTHAEACANMGRREYNKLFNLVCSDKQLGSQSLRFFREYLIKQRPDLYTRWRNTM